MGDYSFINIHKSLLKDRAFPQKKSKDNGPVTKPTNIPINREIKAVVCLIVICLQTNLGQQQLWFPFS